jgi:glycosyltransferase involved in cell wall biosynthesis
MIVERFRQVAEKCDFELILVNNGSTDDTADVIARLQADPCNHFIRTVSVEKNVGYGNGIHTGLLSARGEIVSYSHADLQTPPEDIIGAFELIESGQIDPLLVVIKGLRLGRDQEKFLTRGLSRITAVFTGVRIEDINGQPKVFHHSLLEKMDAPPPDFAYDTYVIFVALREGFQIHNIMVNFEERLHGESKWASTFCNKFKTIMQYLRSIFLMCWSDRQRSDNPVGQLIRFTVSGAITNAINYLTFLTMLRIIVVNYISASILGFLTGLIVGFFMNRNYTFGIAAGRTGLQATKFLLVNILSLILNVLTIYMIVEKIGISPEFGQIMAMIVSASVNFGGMKFWVFSERRLGFESSNTS